MNISRNFVVLSLAVMMLALGACSGLTQSDKPAMRTWWLEPYMDLSPDKTPALPSLLSLSVTVVPGLDTDRILTLSENAELNHYSSARWAENLPELLASLTGRSLESSGRFEVLSAGTAGGRDHCDLHLEVREFFASLEPSGLTSDVRLAVHVRYQCESAEALPLLVKASAPVHDQQMSAIVAAFQQATDDILKKILTTIP